MIDLIADKKLAALKILEDNQHALFQMLEKVSGDLFLYEPAEKWSIAQLVEHIILVENGVLGGIKKVGTHPKEAVINKPVTEEQFKQILHNRARKIEAPEKYVPKGIFTTKASAIKAFKEHRENIADFVNTTDLPLAYIGFPHFALGMLNGFDWLAFMAGHCERHIAQMEEIINEK